MGARLREWMRRLIGLVRPGRSDEDLEAELRSHLALAAEAAGQRAAGAPTEADLRRAVLRAGGVDQAMEAVRDQRGIPLLADLAGDLRQACRLFTRTPALGAMAVLSLALGLALTLTVFRVVQAYVLRGFPYPAPERLYSLVLNEPGRPSPGDADRLDWSSIDDLVEHRIAWDLDVFYLLGGEYPDAVTGAWITPGFVGGLGARVALGRTLSESDFRAGGPTPVLISHRLWHSRFGGDPSVLGRPFTAYFSDRPEEAETLTVAGVLSADFWHINTYTDVLAPLTATGAPYMLLLRPGVDPSIAEARIDALVRGGHAQVPEGWRPRLELTHSRYIASMRPLLAAVASAAALVLLIACANVAILLLVRAIGRQHEMAVRLALGASRARLARLLLAEAVLVGLAATGLAWLCSAAVVVSVGTAVQAHVGRRLPGGLDALAPDAMTAGLAIGLGIVIAIVLTAVPLLGLAVPARGAGLVSAGRSGTAGPAARRVRTTLVAAEVAGALALLVGAALMVDSTRRLLLEDLGLRTDVTSYGIALRRPAQPEAADRARVFTRILREADERSAGLPVALGSHWPLQSAQAIPLVSDAAGAPGTRASIVAVSASYFETFAIPLHDGRAFDVEDAPGGPPVAVVSESLAQRLWPGGRAVGREVVVPQTDGTEPSPAARYQVVGVAGDVRHLSADGAGVTMESDALALYVPLLQQPGHFAFLFVPEFPARRQARFDDGLRRAVAAIDRDAAVAEPQSLAERLDDLRGRPRRLAVLLSTLALFATLLALVGVYGVVSYAVRQREREIGIRMAVGADATAVTRLFLREGGPLVAAGIGGGLVGALALGRVLESQLYGVQPAEPLVLLTATVVLAAGATTALWWPARRAARVDPTDVLRAE